MSTMMAKYSGTCKRCGGSIRAGAPIDYSRATGARHVSCDAAPKKITARKQSTAPRTSSPRGPAPGEYEISRRSTGRGDTYGIGDVVRVQNLETLGGSDGHYGVVTRAGYSAACEDMGWYEPRAWAYVRAATADEAGPVEAARAAHAEREAQLTELLGLVCSVSTLTDAHLPADSRTLAPTGAKYEHGRIWRGATGHRLFHLSADGTVWCTESSYDDMPHQWCVRSERAAALMVVLLGGARQTAG